MAMRGEARLALIGVTVAASVAAAGAALAVQRDGEPRRAGVDWRLEYQHDATPQSMLWTVDASNPSNVWATGQQGSWDGDRPLVVRYDGSQWREIAVPEGYGSYFSRVAATDTGAWVLSVGTDDTVSPPREDSVLLRWTGAGWERHVVPDTRGGGVDAVADDDVWHATISDDDGAVARHWDGGSWSRTALPGDPDSISGVTARAHEDVWVYGSKDDRLYVAHRSGGAWREVAAPPVTAPPEEEGAVYFRDFVVASSGERWALITASSDYDYETLVYQYRDGAWREVEGPEQGTYVLDSLTVDDRGEAWVTRAHWDVVYRRVDQRWVKSELPEPDAGAVELRDISVVGGVAHVAGLTAYDDDGDRYDAVVYGSGSGKPKPTHPTSTTRSPSPQPTRTSAAPSPTDESPTTTPAPGDSSSEPPGGLPTTGNKLGLVAGAGIALLLVGAALLWFGRRRWLRHAARRLR